MDTWTAGDAYEAYVGRWSRLVAAAFVRWLGLPGGLRWLDVGCGTGALTESVLAAASPRSVVGVDPSEGFLAEARSQITDPRASFRLGSAERLPDDEFDVVVSGLALNFTPSPERAVAGFARVVVPGGTVAAYVWDYAEGMELIRRFWDAAGVPELDEGRRFPVCRPEPLRDLWTSFGDVDVQPIDVPTTFRSFDDYWSPFLGGQGPAPGYVATLTEERRTTLRERLRSRLQPETEPDGTIRLTARAWAVRGNA